MGDGADAKLLFRPANPLHPDERMAGDESPPGFVVILIGQQSRRQLWIARRYRVESEEQRSDWTEATAIPRPGVDTTVACGGADSAVAVVAADREREGGPPTDTVNSSRGSSMTRRWPWCPDRCRRCSTSSRGT